MRHPFDAPGTFRFHAVRAIQGVEAADVSDERLLRYARTLVLPGGPGAVEVVATRATGNGPWRLRAHLELASAADVEPAVARARRLFDLDADPAAIDPALAGDSVLAPLIARTPGIRVPGTVDPAELLVRALVGQQISVAAARTHLSRLTQRMGSPYTSTIAGLDRIFPTSAQIASLPEPVPDEALDPDRPLRLPRQAIRAVVATTRALALGELDIHEGADPESLHRALIARPRIGPWTAAYTAMRVLGDPDSWLDGDVALLAGARAIGALEAGLPRGRGHRALAARAQVWAPWRSYAAMHLWQAAPAARGSSRTAKPGAPTADR